MPGYKKTCRHCGRLIAPESNFCPKCGKDNPLGHSSCPKCRNQVEDDDIRCGGCGLDLKAPVITEGK